jgi:hypothetical protein
MVRVRSGRLRSLIPEGTNDSVIVQAGLEAALRPSCHGGGDASPLPNLPHRDFRRLAFPVNAYTILSICDDAPEKIFSVKL